MIFVLDQFVNPQRLTDDFVLRQIAARFHFSSDKLLLMRCERNLHHEQPRMRDIICQNPAVLTRCFAEDLGGQSC